MLSLTVLYQSLLWVCYLSGRQWEILGLSLKASICGAKPSSLSTSNVSISLSNASPCIRLDTIVNDGFRNGQMSRSVNQTSPRTHVSVSPPGWMLWHCNRHLLATCSVWRETQVQHRTTSKVRMFPWLRWCIKYHIFVQGDYAFWDEINEWVGWNLLSNPMWQVMPFTDVVILHHPCNSTATYI